MDGRHDGYQRKVWDPMLMWGLMMMVVVEEVVERKVEAKYVEEGEDYLKVSFYCLYLLKESLVAALQRS